MILGIRWVSGSAHEDVNEVGTRIRFQLIGPLIVEDVRCVVVRINDLRQPEPSRRRGKGQSCTFGYINDRVRIEHVDIRTNNRLLIEGDNNLILVDEFVDRTLIGELLEIAVRLGGREVLTCYLR